MKMERHETHATRASPDKLLLNSPRARLLVAVFIAWLPGNALRKALYSGLLGYSFGAGTRLGYRVVLSVQRFQTGERVTIRRQNCFTGPITVKIADGVFIGRYNRFECGEAAAAASAAQKGYSRHLEIGGDCLINENHLFDVLGTIAIGRGTWVAGFASQFLTHGASAVNRDIRIGEGCFLGSAVRFAPGSGLGDRVILGMGSVVTRNVPESDAVVAGVPAKTIKKREPNDGYKFEKTW